MTTIDLIYFEGCPGHARLLPLLTQRAKASGALLTLRAIETPEQAVTERFLGSPTIRVDGMDVEPEANSRADFGMKCRLYRGDDGISQIPPLEWIDSALRGAD